MNFDTLLENIIIYIVNPLIGLFFLLAFIVFVWGVVRYFLASQSDDARKTGAKHILWGIIGIFIMIAVYAIIDVLTNTLGI